jgi:hypothetical protein
MMGYICPNCDKVYLRKPERCGYCGMRYSPSLWDETPLRVRDLKRLILSLSKKLGFQIAVVCEFFLFHCPDGCGSGHVTGQCIHTTECLSKYYQKAKPRIRLRSSIRSR